MIFKKFIFKILFLACAAVISESNSAKKYKKKIFERCERKFIGSECGPGLECSKKNALCLRVNNQFCFENKECLSGICKKKRCHK